MLLSITLAGDSLVGSYFSLKAPIALHGTQQLPAEVPLPVPCDSLFYIGSSDLRRVSAILPNDRRVVWRTDIYGTAWSRPAVTDNFVYIGASGYAPYEIRHLGGLVALDRQNGRILWRWPTPEAPGSLQTGFVGGPVIDGETLVIGGLDGSLYAFPLR